MTFSPESLEAAAQQATPGPWVVHEGVQVWSERTEGHLSKSASVAISPVDAAFIAMLSPERILLLAELWKATKLYRDEGRTGPLYAVLARLAGHETEVPA